MDPPDFSTFPPFRARGGTLFTFDASRQAWIVSTWAGDWAEIPGDDLLVLFERLREFLESGGKAS